jgi:phage terminase small subunit
MLRGARPKLTVLKVVQGNPGHRRLPQGEPMPDGKPVPPGWLTGRALQLWQEVTAFATWLGRPDGFKLAAWCDRQADFERSRKTWTAADRREHRSAGSELGLDPTSRARVGPCAAAPSAGYDPADEYFK